MQEQHSLRSVDKKFLRLFNHPIIMYPFKQTFCCHIPPELCHLSSFIREIHDISRQYELNNISHNFPLILKNARGFSSLSGRLCS